MFKPDRPIQSFKEDMLGRANFSASLAEALLSYDKRDSIIVGLYGKWGSGKTSIINIVLEQIAQNTKKKRKNHPVIVKFNPWYFSGTRQLRHHFFLQLSACMLKEENRDETRKAGQMLMDYIGLFDSSKPTLVENFSGYDFDLFYNRLVDTFAGLKQQIIIIIDDIDRLINEEIREIFQVIKHQANFPNTIYLTALDKEVVISALEKVQEGSGLEYLEKLIQVPFEIPQISREEVEQFLLRELSDIIQGIPGQKFDSIHWGNVYHSGLKQFFQNMRDVTRYINSLKFGFRMVKEEVNPVDFFGITALNVFTPEVYYGIRENKSLVTSIVDPESPSVERYRQIFDEIMDRNPYYSNTMILELLTRLFPKLDTIYNGTDFDEENISDWRKAGRICTPEIFDTFFRLSIPQGIIPIKTIENILSLAGNPGEFENALLELNREKKIKVFLDRMEDYTGKEIPVKDIPGIIEVLINIGDEFPGEEFGYLGIDTNMRILRITYSLLMRFSTHQERFEIIKNAIKKAVRSINTIVEEVKAQERQHGVTDEDDIPRALEDRTCLEWQLDELKELACEKIRWWAEHGDLAKHRALASILAAWIRWDTPSCVFDFINKITRSDAGLIDFVSAFVIRVARADNVDTLLDGEWRIELWRIRRFAELDKIEDRLRRVFSYPGFKKLEKKKRIAVRTFLDTLDGKIINKY